jgi:hypothetical protein
MSTTKLTGRENLTKYAFWLGPIRPTDKENQVKMYNKYCFSYRRIPNVGHFFNFKDCFVDVITVAELLLST